MIDFWTLGTGAVLGGVIAVLGLVRLSASARAQAYRAGWDAGAADCKNQLHDQQRQARETWKAQESALRIRIEHLQHDCHELRECVEAQYQALEEARQSKEQTIRVLEGATGEAVTEESMERELERIGVVS